MRELNKTYKNLSEMLADGWTREEMQELTTAPRTRQQHNGVFPTVNGFELIFSLWTREEKDNYNAYKKSLPSRSGTSTITVSDDQKKLWASIRDKATKLKDAELLSLLNQLDPTVTKDKDLMALFDVVNVEAVPKKVSIFWVMYKKDGQRSDNKLLTAEDVGPLIVKGYTPELTIAQVKLHINNLLSRGIKVAQVIEGLPA